MFLALLPSEENGGRLYFHASDAAVDEKSEKNEILNRDILLSNREIYCLFIVLSEPTVSLDSDVFPALTAAGRRCCRLK